MDPVKLNLTLSAAAQALTGLGDKFGQSIVNANAILDDVNPQMPQDPPGHSAAGGVSATRTPNAAPDLFDFLNNAVITARTHQSSSRSELDQALLAAAGFGNTGGDIFSSGGPYLVRGAADLVPTAQLLDTYSPELFCTDPQLPRHRAQGRRRRWAATATRCEPTPRLLSGLGLSRTHCRSGSRHRAAVGSAALAGWSAVRRTPTSIPDNLPRVNAAAARGCAGLLAARHP